MAEDSKKIIDDLKAQLAETKKEASAAKKSLAEKEAADKLALGITPELDDYKVPKGEEKDIHLLVEQRSFQQGVKVSSPFVHKLDAAAYVQFCGLQKALNFTVIKELHIPKGTKGVEAMRKHLEGLNEKKKAQKK